MQNFTPTHSSPNMLPPELVHEISNHLGAWDILTFAKVHPAIYDKLKPVLKMLADCPYFLVRYSQWNSWRTAASHYEPQPQQLKFKTARCAVHLDEPLPDDFQALRSHVAGAQAWQTCDRGLMAPSTREVFDMTARPNCNNRLEPAPPPIVPSHLINPTSLLAFKANSYVFAMSVIYCQSTDLHVWYRDGKRGMVILDDGPMCGHRFKLQLIDDTVFSLAANSTDPSENAVSCIVRGMIYDHPLTNISSGINPEGLLLYNGHLFKAAVNEDDELIVATLDFDIPGEGCQWSAKYDIYQDDRNPRYGLAYFKGSGVLIYVIDLLKHTVINVQRYQELGFVGFSKGKPGVWRYTRDYLVPRFKSRQRSPALRLAFEAMGGDMLKVSEELQDVI